jgi:hypothetical protein
LHGIFTVNGQDGAAALPPAKVKKDKKEKKVTQSIGA